MSSNKGDVDIGFDPLAWMNEEEKPKENLEESAKSTEPVAESATGKEEDSVETASAQETETAKITSQPVKEVKEVKAVESPVEVPVASGDGYRVNLAGKTDISTAEQLKDELEEALQQSDAIILVAEEVERADGAALQLLTAFVRKIEDAHRELTWESPSEQFIAAANILGLKETLQLP